MESKHTPGPWYVDGWYGETALFRATNGSVTNGEISICMVQGDNSKPMEANARLIAAAPELLEALVEMLTEYVKQPEYVPNIAIKARDAIVKATGK